MMPTNELRRLRAYEKAFKNRPQPATPIISRFRAKSARTFAKQSRKRQQIKVSFQEWMTEGISIPITQ